MFLRTLEIKNYRSLEHGELNRLGDFNVLIGRNNAGKSAVFGALSLLNRAINGTGVNWDSILTSRDTSRKLELRLVFELSAEDRNKIIDLIDYLLAEERLLALNNSPFVRQVEFAFQGSQKQGAIRGSGLRLLGEDGKWATVIGEVGNDTNTKATNIKDVAQRSVRLEQHVLDIAQTSYEIGINIRPNFVTQFPQEPSEAIRWLYWRLGRYLGQAFFFNPFRHNESELPSQQPENLAQDGSNLAQVLHTINSNDRELFAKIEGFMHAALPDIGRLQAPLTNNLTHVAFRLPDGGYPVRLHDMGGGIEQLLMVATVLLTTSADNTIFLEEPESHL